ncbi:hypothetical protein CsatA_015989 [Cannabis sativa]
MLPGEFTGLYYLPVSPDDHHHQNPISLPIQPNFNNVNIISPNCTSNNVMDPIFHLNSQFLNANLPNYPPPQTTSSATTLSNNSTTSDEAEEMNYHNNNSEQLRIVIDERRQRRMISNRESARRSRMRKQKHLDELWSQVVRLRTENHNLIDKLNNMSESHDRVLQENSRLKEEASDLRQMLTALQIGSPNNYNDAVLRTATIHDQDDDDDNGDDHDYHDHHNLDHEGMVDHNNNTNNNNDLNRNHNHRHHHNNNEIKLPCNAAHLRAEISSTNIATSVDLLH